MAKVTTAHFTEKSVFETEELKTPMGRCLIIHNKKKGKKKKKMFDTNRHVSLFFLHVVIFYKDTKL